MIGINKNYPILNFWFGKFSLSVRIRRVSDGRVQIVTVVYGPYERGLHTQLWEELTTIRNKCDDL